MAVVWRRARKDFTFQGAAYRAGQVFAVPPIVAVQMRNRVDKAKVPAEPEQAVQTRRRGRKPVSAPVAPEPSPEPTPEPAEPEIDLDTFDDDL